MRLVLSLAAVLILGSGCSMFQSDVDCAMVDAMKNAVDKVLPQYREYVKGEKFDSVKDVRNDSADELESAIQALYDAACGKDEE